MDRASVPETQAAILIGRQPRGLADRIASGVRRSLVEISEQVADLPLGTNACIEVQQNPGPGQAQVFLQQQSPYCARGTAERRPLRTTLYSMPDCLKCLAPNAIGAPHDPTLIQLLRSDDMANANIRCVPGAVTGALQSHGQLRLAAHPVLARGRPH